MGYIGRLRARLASLLNGGRLAAAPDSPSSQMEKPGSMAALLAGLKRRGPFVQTIIDVGASDARWSREALRYFPDANYLLVEAQNCHAEALQAFASAHANARVVMAAAGAERGMIYFDASDPFGGQASGKESPGSVSIPVTSLDGEISTCGFAGPYLLKLDTHGFEIPILQGAAGVLGDASALIIECYNFRLSEECLLFHEMCALMSERGFRCLDIADVMHREMDAAFWQMDVLFVRDDREEFHFSAYRRETSSGA